MHLVTLTTDFGLHDYYIPAIKGAMLSRFDDIHFIDVSHNIKNHDIVQAAYILKNTWQNFPDGTIHVVSVNNFGGERHRFLVILHHNHYFIGPDNGIFSLLFDDTPQYVYEIPFAGLNFAFVRDSIADAVGYIAKDNPIADIGLAVSDMVQRITLQPVLSINQIRGAIIHIDNYDNAIVNISKDLFNKVGHGRSFSLYFKRYDPITKLSQYYNDVPIGEALCLFNSDNLEISINMGRAAEMLGLKVEDTIQIDFHIE